VQTKKSRNTKILPVIMCGGSGSRMWPESRESLPKQFLPLIGDRSTFQSIVGVVGDPAVFDPAVVITNFDYRFRVAEQLKEIGAKATILLEPERRDRARPSAPTRTTTPRPSSKA
jgi:mannose-1-phosphate guanylyltransferase/mannose-6-phosphate isomerase